MEINITTISDQEKELEITVPWEIIEDDYKDLLKRYAKVPFKGFRPGKAPLGAIESFFKNEIKNDVIAATSARICRSALKEKELEAGTPIELSEIELIKNKFLTFKAAFVEMPTFELPAYENLGLEATETDEKLNEISEKLLERTNIVLHPVFIENEMKYTENAESLSEEEKKDVAKRVKLMLILKKIANLNGIEISEREIDERIELIAKENEVTPGELKDYLMTNKGWSRLSESLLAETVLSYIIEIQPLNK